MIEDKLVLTRARVELVGQLATKLSTPDLVRVQGELSIVNAKIKALNTTEAAMKKAAADRSKSAGLAEAQSNARRAIARAQTKHSPSSVPGTLGIAGPIGKLESDAPDDEDDDPGQIRAIDGWIDAVLLRLDVEFTRDAHGDLSLMMDHSRPHAPENLATAVEVLIAGIRAAARGQAMPDPPSALREPRISKPGKGAKPKKR